MAIFGKKDDKDKNIKNENKVQDADLDAILTAIDETDEEEAAAKEAARKAHQEQLEANRKAAEAAKVREELAKTLPNDGRRYFMLAEEVTVDEDEQIKITGNIFGDIRVGDEIYIYKPNNLATAAKVTGIYGVNAEKEAEAAKNSRVQISIDYKLNGADVTKIIPRFAVVSDVRPQISKDGKMPQENPALFGVTLGYKDFKDDRDYNGAFITSLAGSKLIIPVNSSKEDLENKKINFKMIKHEDKVFLPTFTDWATLRMWKDLFEGDTMPNAICIPFMDLAKVTAKDGVDFMINAYGPTAIHLPRQVIDSLFDAKKKADEKRKLQEQVVKAKDAKNIMVGEPPINDETKAIREALREYAKNTPAIAKFGFLATNKGGKMGYLLVVDCPDANKADIAAGMVAAAKPYMNKIKSIAFSVYAQTQFADEYFARIPYDYVRIGNY